MFISAGILLLGAYLSNSRIKKFKFCGITIFLEIVRRQMLSRRRFSIVVNMMWQTEELQLDFSHLMRTKKDKYHYQENR